MSASEAPDVLLGAECEADVMGDEEPANCPQCGGDMDRGFIEGRYFAWVKSPRWGFARMSIDGVLSEQIGERRWGPKHLRADRCRSCGVGIFYE